MDRLIVTIQLWVVQAGGNVIVIDTGVGNRKPRSAAARMDQLNTLVMPWLEVDRRRAGAGDACGDDPPAHRSRRLEHGREGRQMGADLPEGALSHSARPSSTTGRALYDKGDKDVNQGSFADSVLPIVDAGLGGFHGRHEGSRRLPRARAGARPCARHAVVPPALARRGRPVLRRHHAQRDPDRAAGLERPLLPLARQGAANRAPPCSSARPSAAR